MIESVIRETILVDLLTKMKIIECVEVAKAIRLILIAFFICRINRNNVSMYSLIKEYLGDM